MKIPHLTIALVGLLGGAVACSAPTNESPRGIVRIDPPAGAGAMAPNWVTGEPCISLSWIEPVGSGHALRFSRLDDRGGWSPAGTAASGDRFFVNWADFPSLARAADGTLVAHWLERSGPGTYAYDVQLARSTDAGASWTRLGPAHDDGVRAEHGFVSLLAGPEGVRAFWLDGRLMGGEEEDHGDEENPLGAMTLRTALLDAAGAPTAGEQLDERVCECCQTSAALTAEGPVVVYRDRSDKEIRDISIIRRTARGWTQPAPVHRDGWEIPACPVNGPSIASGGAGSRRLAVAWFTTQADHPRVQVIFSEDAGTTFGTPAILDASQPLGRVGVVLTKEGDAIVSWLSGLEGEAAEVRLARVSPAGRAGESITIAATARSRASGFPRMTLLGKDLALAWTETGNPSHVRAARVPVSMIPAGREAAAGAAVSPAPVGQGARTWDRQPGSKAPDYTARTPEGEAVSLSALRGSAVLLNLWATWCAPCRAETPDLISLHEQHASRGLRVIGVSVDVDLSSQQVRSFARQEKIPYTILHDYEDRASTLFVGQQMLPASFLFDRQGILVWSRIGLLDKDDPDLAAAIGKALTAAGE
jgi:peroxiredoxin